MKKLLLLLCFTAFCLSSATYAQISPPGLGEANTAGWFAFGLRQDLGVSKKWQSMSYIGLGRKSNPDNYALFFKPAILVINQEFYHRFHPHWQYSIALSYRKQEEYNDFAPYRRTVAGFEREWRLYGRMAYTIKNERLKFTTTFRQELRTFAQPFEEASSEDLQLRSRLKLQLAINLDKHKIHKLIGGYESLFSTSRSALSERWSSFKYRESRFTFYYSISPQELPFTIDLGYMNNLVGSQSPFSAHYLALDVIYNNPLGLLRHKQGN
ncbi:MULTISPECIES: DUF2490 domain-containing protein [Olivibacter]|jgi:hypothetical protein|uniref:DUF2490 domain-containing protein n=1 Tax=Olivibacter oleidegradans TaxID=760123 RepID=A0ABV6HS64_9SPHI|nr:MULTISPECIES: DUF2490 domain-containing protein [unclassified Olivibacter]MDM8176343.1 DUF2490 domain-containing protein [Olivibacter sp. 47]QEL01159.1 DUF2490 domain-containing protein [Olivibacter sp. LS-1]